MKARAVGDVVVVVWVSCDGGGGKGASDGMAGLRGQHKHRHRQAQTAQAQQDRRRVVAALTGVRDPFNWPRRAGAADPASARAGGRASEESARVRCERL